MNPGSGPENSTRGEEPREDAGFYLSNPTWSFVSTVRIVLLSPADFFRRLLPREGSLWSPVVFALLCILISLPLSLLVLPYDPLTGNEAGVEGFADLFPGVRSSAGAAGLAVIFLVLASLGALLGLFVSAAVYHVLVRIAVRPTNTDFYATLRVISYTSAVELLTWIPVVGLLASLYGLYLAFIGIREMHETTTRRALAVIALPVDLFVIYNVLPLFPQEAQLLGPSLAGSVFDS